MLISTDAARTFNTDSRLACTLAAVAGALNTAAFESVGFFGQYDGQYLFVVGSSGEG